MHFLKIFIHFLKMNQSIFYFDVYNILILGIEGYLPLGLSNGYLPL